jgi:adenylate cyclase
MCGTGATGKTLAESKYSLRSEGLAAQKSAFRGRLIAMSAISPLLLIVIPWPASLFTVSLIAILSALGWCAWRIQMSSWDRPWFQYAFVTADFVVVTIATLYPNPLLTLDLPPQFSLRFGSFIYFFILMAGLAYVYQPKLVLWGGISAAICWSAGVLFLIEMPETVWRQSNDPSVEEIAQNIGNLYFIDVSTRVQEVVVILVVSGLLALAVRRSRSVAVRQASLASERSNLARYFPKKTAEMLAERSNPFSTPNEHNCAVLFADLVGFTTWSENHSPVQTIELLRDVHGILADIIFSHEGTLDKFMGDGLMATFGTPEPTSKDASNAIAAMRDMANAFEAWKSAPSNTLANDLKLAIGVHYGPVVIGNIGSEQRLEFAVLGDTVNVASRLEAATREIGCRCLVSRDLVEAAKGEDEVNAEELVAELQPHDPIQLRGRAEKIEVLFLL